MQGTTYSHSEGECCGHCRKSSCVEGGRLRQASIQCLFPPTLCLCSNALYLHVKDILFNSTCVQVGEQWVSPQDRCVWSQCVQVNEEVFIQHTNTSCHLMDTPTCPLGTELQCNTVEACCPTCHCGTNSFIHTQKVNLT